MQAAASRPRSAPSWDPEDGIPTVDWQGAALSCEGCVHVGQPGTRCTLSHACVLDRYARRIDRFFRWNPHLANSYLQHPYFEVRAVACKYADVFRLPALAQDEDETVRLSVAMRLPQRQLAALRTDPHREVRIRVAQRLDTAELGAMCSDPDYYVRLIVARRLPDAMLPRMVSDRDREVRAELARRLPMPGLLALADDEDESVRVEVARRLPEALLDRYAHDAAWLVRWETANRAGAELAARLCADPDGEVREAARRRLDSLKREHRHG